MTIINPPSEDIKDMLESSGSGLGLVTGTDLFIAIMPPEPNNVVVIRDSGGMNQLKYGMERPSVQIVVRNNEYKAGYEIVKDIKYYLEGKNGEIWNGTNYISVINRSEIGFMGQDADNRFEWSVNFQIYRTA